MKNKLDPKSFVIGILTIMVLINSISWKRPSVEEVKPPPKEVEVKVLSDQTTDYMFALSLLESDNNSRAHRPGSQFTGKYQIGNAVRTDIGLSVLNDGDGKELFLSDDKLQDLVMFRLLQFQIGQMESYITKYDRTKVGRWYVTKSGIIAMAHLLGVSNAKRFLDSNGTYVPRDGNGIPITDYLQLNNFNIQITSINSEEYFKSFALLALNLQ